MLSARARPPGNRQAEAARKVDRLVAAIATGAGEFQEVRDALAEAKGERDVLTRRIADLEALPIVALHPTIAAEYRKQVEELHIALADPAARLTAVPAMRALVDRIVLTPNPNGRGVLIEVEGKLASIVAFATGRKPSEELTAKVERVKGIEPSS